MLRLNEITTEYTGMKALHGVSITVDDNEIVAIVGSNGAGKSTLLKTISGTAKCTSGKVLFRDADITQMEAHKRTSLGIIHIPEGRQVFPSMTVIENLEVGAYCRKARASLSENLRHVLEFFPILKQRSKQLAGSLSGGEQQMLAIGRGLMTTPLLLMLDEPSLGVSPLLTSFIFDTVKSMHEKLKFSVILVEQRAVEALELCDRGYVLESGRVNMSGTREELMGNPMVQKAYLGVA
ncbi:MAG: ABC transporter ATP-binding protein [Thermodesulfobacteriota bacterium]